MFSYDEVFLKWFSEPFTRREEDPRGRRQAQGAAGTNANKKSLHIRAGWYII